MRTPPPSAAAHIVIPSVCPTFTVEDDVLLRGADVRFKVQAVSFIQLTRQTAPGEQAHGFYTEEKRHVMTKSSNLLRKRKESPNLRETAPTVMKRSRALNHYKGNF